MLPIPFSDTDATSQDGSHSAIFRMQGPEGCAQEVKVLGWCKHTDTQTNTQTSRIVDRIRPEGQFGNNNCLTVSFP